MEKRKIIPIAFFFLSFFLGLYSCTPPRPGSGSPPSGINLSIQSPEYSYAVGSPFSQQNKQPNFSVRIRVQTLDPSGNATVYRSYNLTRTYTSIGNDPWINQTIDVPATGTFVVQVEIIHSECTSPFSGCSISVGGAGKKEYFRQLTFTSKPSSITMPFNSSNISFENYGC